MIDTRSIKTIASCVALAGLVGLAGCGGEEVEVGNNAGDNAAENNTGENNTGENNGGENNAENNADPNNNQGNNTQPGCTDDATCGDGNICERGACAPGCRDNDGCTDGTACVDGACVECAGDSDCTVGFVCESSDCVEGCRDDAGCAAGSICEDGACAPGCRDDAACDEGSICEDGACAAGCREDAGCDVGSICEDGACAPGCRDDVGCDDGSICTDAACAPGCREDAQCADGLCLESTCVVLGVGCREDADCNEGDVCDIEAARCEAGQTPCTPDALEGDTNNDTADAAATVTEGTTSGLSICPADVDFFTIALEAGDRLDVRVVTEASLLTRLRDGETLLAEGVAEAGGYGLDVDWGDAAGAATLEVVGETAEVRGSYGLEVVIIGAGEVCVDTAVYADADADGYGAEGSEETQCIFEGQPPTGFATSAGDCADDDGWRNEDADEICGDWVDDDCDGADFACPETQPSVVVPDWDCTGDPPTSVYAYARFDDGQGYFQDGGCFTFFEGLPGEFYVKRDLERASTDPSCATRNGCTCPSLNGWSSYDRRLYAFTSIDDAAGAACEISIRDHGGEEQDVSNACRKYLYQLHFYDIPFSFVAASQDALERRLASFPTVEVACAEDAPHANLPFQSLMTTTVVRNPGFVAQ